MSSARRTLLLAAAAVALILPLALGVFSTDSSAEDADTAGLPRFAVASIHPTHETVGNCGLSPEGYHCETTTPRELIKSAYGIEKDCQIDRVPTWADSAHYAIDAKVDDADVATLRSLGYRRRNFMLQPLLRDRFHLKAHWETRTLQVYVLSVAKGGPRLQRPGADDATKHPRLGDAIGGNGSIIMGPNGQAIGQQVPVSMLVHLLSAYTQRLILDRTGLSGTWDFSVQLPRAQPGPDGRTFIGFGGSSMAESERAAEADPSSSTTLFTAVADLGLKLQLSKAPVQVLVIDEITPPSDN